MELTVVAAIVADERIVSSAAVIRVDDFFI
jgi:hypothetical protein